MELDEGMIYFKNNGIIKMVGIPRHGTVRLKIQDGVIVFCEKTTNQKIE
ncbi:DUF2292 domain-containing protein [Streptococcus hyovaginalis]|uniref:DUF2292 domain-containing protein n=1 Tax=Streptococcus agalactiae LMG 14747 TaxID=1154860 RepID=V6YZ52_STRAG|nr:DUF2292 domain-containing protein [Streptococcus hyovaginalis]ESV53788.1 hypothetical protein SAG0136_00620 [Streptococcus agalactiae LMG 14747]HEM6117140.1 DUF2292 domain-containing protein [Streptococcus suis]